MDDKFFEEVATSEKIEAKRPGVGKTVKIIKGRKHLGEVGLVKWHGEDKFNPPFLGITSREHMFLIERIGRLGYRIKVQPEGGEAFFVCADYAEVI